jgi:hypothetical protein
MKLGLNLWLNKNTGGYSKEARGLRAKIEDDGFFLKTRGFLKQNLHLKGYGVTERELGLHLFSN